MAAAMEVDAPRLSAAAARVVLRLDSGALIGSASRLGRAGDGAGAVLLTAEEAEKAGKISAKDVERLGRILAEAVRRQAATARPAQAPRVRRRRRRRKSGPQQERAARCARRRGVRRLPGRPTARRP